MSGVKQTETKNGRHPYATYLKPTLADLLAAIKLDVIFERAAGDYLYYRDESGAEQAVLDLLGGYGSTLFGHNHPALVQIAQDVLARQRPFGAQASIRHPAGRLAEKLATIVAESTGKEYIVTLASTGTEAVEAALKHAALEKTTAVQAILEKQKKTFRQLRLANRQNQIQISDAWLAQAARELGVPHLTTLEELEYFLSQYNENVLTAAPKFLAVQGAFHGKTSGALMLTYNKDFRLPWQKLGLNGQFIPFNDVDALTAVVTAEATQYYELVQVDRRVELVKRPWSPIAGCLAEPIQGEGGIRELTAPFLQALRQAADTWNYPLIFDEIQSGMGRTGTFLAAQPSGVVADYYLFSKSLGGGLAKVSALLVRRGRYQQPFGLLHTSTFAEDDFASAIALGALDLLTANEGALIQACAQKGEYLLSHLNGLKSQFPSLIKEVRGRGLLIGIELKPQTTQTISPLLRVLSEQNLLSYLLSGYLLHEANMRITPTLSAHNTIRIEPSAYISYEDMDRFCTALAEAFSLLAAADMPRLVRFITGENPIPVQISRQSQADLTNHQPEATVERQVACLAHFMEPKDLRHWDPSLQGLSDEACQTLLNQAGPLLEPFIAAERVVNSPLGERIGLTIIGIPSTSTQIKQKMNEGDTEDLLAQLEQGVEMARQRGCTVVGFTGYTSIVSRNCTAVIADDIALTSGNSLTAAAAITAARQAAAEMGIAEEAMHLAVVGAVGNIGRVMAEVAADFAPRLTLYGRTGAQKRLRRVAESIYADAWLQVQQGEPLQGIAQVIAQTETIAQCTSENNGHNGRILLEGLHRELGAEAPIQITTDLDELRHSNVIISATNAPQPLIQANHIGEQQTLLCDVAVPADVDVALLAEKPQARLIKGGILSLPLGQDLAIGGMDVPPGQAYACVSESLLLGMAGISSHFSYGMLQANRVKQAIQLAESYQFTVVAQEETYVPVFAR